MLKAGDEILLLGVGPIIAEALKARKELKADGVNLAVASMGSIKPLDQQFLKACLEAGYRKWISLGRASQIRRPRISTA